MKTYLLINGIAEDSRILEQLSKQGILIEDWDLILILPRCSVNDELAAQFVRYEEDKPLCCNEYQLNRIVEDCCGDAAWYENIEVCDDTCWVGVKYH